MTTNFNIHIRDDLNTISEFWPRGGAHSVSEGRYHVFQTIAFLKVWWETFGQSARTQACFVEVYDEVGRPVIFIPLCVRSRMGAKILQFIDDDAADYNAPIVFAVAWKWTSSLAEQLWQQIRTSLPPFDALVFNKMPADVGGLVNPLHLLSDGPDTVFCHGNNLRQPWDIIDKGQPYRKTLLKKMRGLGRIGPCEYIIAGGQSERAEFTEKLLQQKQRRFEETKVPGFDADPNKYNFFRQGTEAFAKAGMLHLSALKVGDETVATLWGLVQDKHYCAIMIGFASGEWAKYSCGRIIYYQTLHWLHMNGFEYMDLGIGDEPWKLEHCDTTVPLSQKFSVLTWRGSVFMKATSSLEHLRRTLIWQKARPLKWLILRWMRRISTRAAKAAKGNK